MQREGPSHAEGGNQPGIKPRREPFDALNRLGKLVTQILIIKFAINVNTIIILQTARVGHVCNMDHTNYTAGLLLH